MSPPLQWLLLDMVLFTDANPPSGLRLRIKVTYKGLPCEDFDMKALIQQKMQELLKTLTENSPCLDRGKCNLKVTVDGCDQRKKRDISDTQTSVNIIVDADPEFTSFSDETDYDEEEGILHIISFLKQVGLYTQKNYPHTPEGYLYP